MRGEEDSVMLFGKFLKDRRLADTTPPVHDDELEGAFLIGFFEDCKFLCSSEHRITPVIIILMIIILMIQIKSNQKSVQESNRFSCTNFSPVTRLSHKFRNTFLSVA